MAYTRLPLEVYYFYLTSATALRFLQRHVTDSRAKSENDKYSAGKPVMVSVNRLWSL